MCYCCLHQGKPFLKHLELKTCGWHNDRHSENFHCRVWARIKILFSSFKSYDHMSPLEGRVHHIDYMFIHLSCMHQNEKWVPYESTTPDFERKAQQIKIVLVVTSTFKKSWSLRRKAWLASSLLEQKLKNNSGEVPSNWSIIFVQTPTTTQPEEIGGKYGQEPQHNTTFLKKAFVWRLTEGELHHQCRMESVLVL